MRTTLNLNDDLYREVKVVAAERGVSATSVIEEALRAALRAGAQTQRPELPVSLRSSGLRPGVDLADRDQLYDLLYGDADSRAVAVSRG
jgi:plasmid stability protein